MRQFICIFSAFALLIGCVKIDPTTTTGQESEAVIAFDCPIMANNLKSVAEYHTYPDNFDFKVWGYYSKNSYPDVSDGELHTLYMNGAVFTKTGATWASAGKNYYWPKNGFLHFVAYAPASPKIPLAESTVTDQGLQLTGYTIPDNADEDLLISQVAYACTKPEVEGAGAPLLFHHALSSIVFKVNSGIYEDRNSDGGVDTDLRITKIEIVDARAQGNFSQQMSDWMGEQMNAPTDEQNPEKGWDVPANALLKTFTAYDKQKVGSEGQLLTDNFEFIHDMAIADERTQSLTNLLMLPQELKENVLLRVTFDMTHSDITYWLTDRVKTIPLNKCGVEEWLRGYRYCYYITLSLNKIVCSTEVDQWNDYETLENLENATIKDLNETVYELE